MEQIRLESIEAILRWCPKNAPGRHDQETHGSWATGTAKEPWQMTQAEFAGTVTERVDRVPSITFDEWTKQKGYTDLEHESDVADWVGGVFGESTAHGRGKLTAIAARMANTAKALEDYGVAVDNGEVPLIEKRRPIERGREMDEAKIRILHKRSIRAAISEGKPVPPEVLADYPELMVQ